MLFARRSSFGETEYAIPWMIRFFFFSSCLVRGLLRNLYGNVRRN